MSCRPNAQRPKALPQLGDRPFFTCGGLETTSVFHRHLPLPHFAAFDLLKSDSGRTVLLEYYRSYAAMYRDAKVGVVFVTPTWRASPDWGLKLGYDSEALATANVRAVELLQSVREEFETKDNPVVIAGCIGPRGDGYQVGAQMSAEDAEAYHRFQVGVLAGAGVDMIQAMSLTYPAEAVGMVRGAQAAVVPIVVSFTTEIDGRIPNGESLQAAVETVDSATAAGPVYYAINCSHPTHFEGQLTPASSPWVGRIRAINANASRKSHAELDEATALDDGDPEDLAQRFVALRSAHPHLTVLGGCCGTDIRHLRAILAACAV